MRYGTGSRSDAFPGNNLPDYDHIVPPGQQTVGPVHEFAATPDGWSFGGKGRAADFAVADMSALGRNLLNRRTNVPDT